MRLNRAEDASTPTTSTSALATPDEPNVATRAALALTDPQTDHLNQPTTGEQLTSPRPWCRGPTLITEVHPDLAQRPQQANLVNAPRAHQEPHRHEDASNDRGPETTGHGSPG
jgi:hypothetical protein